MCNMPESIGMWMILDENVVVWGSMEWTIPKLIIRTQLNIHTMDRVKEWEITETKSSSSFWYNVKRNWIPYFLNRESQKSMIIYIDFHEFILTVVVWRKPDMIPDDVSWGSSHLLRSSKKSKRATWWFRKTHSLSPKPFTLSTLDHLYNLKVWYLAVIGVSCMYVQLNTVFLNEWKPIPRINPMRTTVNKQKILFL